MQRKSFVAVLIALLLLMSGVIQSAQAAENTLSFQDIPSLIRPGKTERISFLAPISAIAKLELRDNTDSPIAVIRDNLAASPGLNSIFWNGLDPSGQAIPAGDYRLVLTLGEQPTTASIILGTPSPQLSALQVSDPAIVPGSSWSISALASMAGTLRLMILEDDLSQKEISHREITVGEIVIPWDGMLDLQAAKAGTRTLSLTLTDAGGFTSNPYHLVVSVRAIPEATPQPSPSPKPYKIPSLEPIAPEQEGKSYWTLPVGQWNEKAIWDVMIQPFTIIQGGDQRETYKLRAAPDKSTERSNIVGEITYVSQGVHVLETLDNGWSLIEANNSSYGPDNRTRRGYGDTDEVVKGYVETKYLEVTTPRTDYGVLIDKLKQEMYVFKEGKLFTTLIISTGNPTKQQPWNETPSGEYLMVSRVGDFLAGNLVCPMGMRINGGSLLHEVPYILNETTGWKDYSIQERQLGIKASHGCIRVQRKPNSEGVNMTWLWNNIKVNTKVLVWDDFPGRYYEYPADDLMLYQNPDNGQYYHLDQNCASIRDRFLPLKGSFTYAELDDADHQSLTPCKSCNPPLRKAQIDKINSDTGF
jgi:hypothetical protein